MIYSWEKSADFFAKLGMVLEVPRLRNIRY
jgi:hypothetical protein